MMASHVVTVVILVITCLVIGGDTYRLADDVLRSSLHQHSHEQQQEEQQEQQVNDAGDGLQLDVRVSPEFTVMNGVLPVNINCSTTSLRRRRNTYVQPYMAFFWQILADTSLPLSSSVPGVSVHPILQQFTLQNADVRRRRRSVSGGRTGTSGQVYTSKLVLNWRFYNYLARGDNQFGCIVFTLDGRRSVRYFTVHKL